MFGHTVTVLSFMGTASMFSKETETFLFPLAIHQDSNFFTFSATLVIVCLFDHNHSSEYKVLFHCGSDLHFTGT